MEERIKLIRKNKKMTQSEFAESLNLASNYIYLLESGKKPITDKVIGLICSTYNISEEWLRTGEGEMEAPMTREAAIAEISLKLIREDNPHRLVLQKLITDMNAEQIQFLYETAKKWLEEVENEKDRQE